MERKIVSMYPNHRDGTYQININKLSLKFNLYHNEFETKNTVF